MQLDNISLKALEIEEVLLLFSNLASTDIGRTVTRSCDFKSFEQIEEIKSTVSSVEAVTDDDRFVPPMSVEKFLPFKVESLNIRDIVELAVILENVEFIRSIFAKKRQKTLLLSVDDLLLLIKKVFDSSGAVKEDASSILHSLHKKVTTYKSRLRKVLKKYEPEIITIYNGRFLLLVSQEKRSYIKGIVHGLSQSGKSVYLEPFEAIDLNNNLNLLYSEIKKEENRVISKVYSELEKNKEKIEANFRYLGYLDFVQVVRILIRRYKFVFPDFDNNHLEIEKAIHPLLDGRFNDFRSLPQSKPFIPINFKLNKQGIVISGPNAGGKTVTLKTIGVVLTLAYLGFPVPAAYARLPRLDFLIVSVGDEQSISENVSTFMAKLMRMRKVFEFRDKKGLVLFDELGSGSDPNESIAISLGFIETMLEKGFNFIVTSNILDISFEAMKLEGVEVASMVYDEQKRLPLYKMEMGLPSSSYALDLAKKVGIPQDMLKKVYKRIGKDHSHFREVIRAVEIIRRELELERKKLSRRIEELTLQSVALEEEKKKLEHQRKHLKRYFANKFALIHEEVSKKLEEELQNLKLHKKNLVRSLQRVFKNVNGLDEFTEVNSCDSKGGDIKVGVSVRHKIFGWEGIVKELKSGFVVVSVGGKNFKVQEEEIVSQEKELLSNNVKNEPRINTKRLKSNSIDLRGCYVDHAIAKLDKFIDSAIVDGLEKLEVIHGHGTGKLRRAIREYLKQDARVFSFESGVHLIGDDGVTFVYLNDR